MAFFKCPLTEKLICDPVSLEDGQVCERVAIEEWFRRGHQSSPLTGLALQSMELKPVPEAKRTVAQYIDQHPSECLPQLDPVTIDRAITAFQAQCTAEVVMENPGDFGWEVKVVPAQKYGASAALGADMVASRIADLVALLGTGPDLESEKGVADSGERMAEKNHALQTLENLCIYNPGDKIKNNSIALAIRNTGGIRPLAALAHNGTRAQQDSAGFLLWKIAIPENEKSFAQANVPFALYTLLQRGTAEAKKYAQNALDELEKVAETRRLRVQLSDDRSDYRIPLLIEQLSEDALQNSEHTSEAVNILMKLADLAAIDPDNPMAIKNANGIPLVTKLLEGGSMALREAAAMVMLNICVPQNELAIKDAGAVSALRALDFEGPPSAQYVATKALETLMRLEADRRFVEAQKRALWPSS